MALQALYCLQTAREGGTERKTVKSKKDLKKSKKVLDKQNKVRYTNSVPNTNTTGRKEIRPTNEKENRYENRNVSLLLSYR